MSILFPNVTMCRLACVLITKLYLVSVTVDLQKNTGLIIVTNGSKTIKKSSRCPTYRILPYSFMKMHLCSAFWC